MQLAASFVGVRAATASIVGRHAAGRVMLRVACPLEGFRLVEVDHHNGAPSSCSQVRCCSTWTGARRSMLWRRASALATASIAPLPGLPAPQRTGSALVCWHPARGLATSLTSPSTVGPGAVTPQGAAGVVPPTVDAPPASKPKAAKSTDGGGGGAGAGGPAKGVAHPQKIIRCVCPMDCLWAGGHRLSSSGQ
jgi:hypothetical protein